MILCDSPLFDGSENFCVACYHLRPVADTWSVLRSVSTDSVFYLVVERSCPISALISFQCSLLSDFMQEFVSCLLAATWLATWLVTN